VAIGLHGRDGFHEQERRFLLRLQLDFRALFVLLELWLPRKPPASALIAFTSSGLYPIGLLVTLLLPVFATAQTYFLSGRHARRPRMTPAYPDGQTVKIGVIASVTASKLMSLLPQELC
jgi:hypothetical protein